MYCLYFTIKYDKMQIMKILIDADGCPVVKITESVAKRYKTNCIIFCDTSHSFESEYSEIITVSKGSDSVDFAIANSAENGDIVVTQDYGLSAMALSKGAFPITQNGLVIDESNIETLLMTRYISKKQRQAGVHLKGPSKRTKHQDLQFEKALEELINK